jgi:hypothetical protein
LAKPPGSSIWGFNGVFDARLYGGTIISQFPWWLQNSLPCQTAPFLSSFRAGHMKEASMKKLYKLLGIITIGAVIVIGLVGCESLGGGGYSGGSYSSGSSSSGSNLYSPGNACSQGNICYKEGGSYSTCNNPNCHVNAVLGTSMDAGCNCP